MSDHQTDLTGVRVLRQALARARRALRKREISVTLDMSIPHARLGTEYGGWNVCLAGLNRDSVIYSGGVGEDISFDVALHHRTGARIFAFDPTPRAIQYVNQHPEGDVMTLLPVALGDEDGTIDLYPPPNPAHVSHSVFRQQEDGMPPLQAEVRRIGSIMRSYGHRTIDVLKLDIEGAEYRVIDDLLQEDILPGQILVEFHHRLPGVSRRDTKQLLKALRRRGYRLFAATPDAQEVSMIRVRQG